MKKPLFLLLLTMFALSAPAQVIKKLGDRAKQKLEQKAEEKVDKTIDEATNGKPKNAGNSTGNEEETATNNNGIMNAGNPGTAATEAQPAALTAYSRYDFIQGEKVVAYEDFSNAAIGDFPARWNTDGSAEVVTLNNKPGKWLKISDRGYFYPEFIKEMPENSTLEFDLGVSSNYEWGSSSIYMFITELEDKNAFSQGGFGKTMVLEFHPLTGENYTGGLGFRTMNATSKIHNTAHIKNWDGKNNNFAHVSLWRQGQRLRMYVNGSKIIDLPKAFDADGKYTDVIFQTNNIMQEKNNYVVLGNFRLAIGAPDTRNKLVTEGRFVTSGITFDVNSDKLKPESFGVLKEIATVMNENPELKVKIIGHTDSDGDDASNLSLSKRRAAAVKAALTAEFRIDEARMISDGLGEGKPVGDNKTAEGKAQNRRVEFVKM